MNVSLTQQLAQCESLKTQCSTRLDTIRSDLPGHANEVKDLAKLFKQYVQSKEQAEKSAELEYNKKGCCGCLNNSGIKTATVAAFILNFISWGMIGGIAIYNLSTKTEEETGTDIAQVSITILSILLTAVLADLIKNISDDKDQQELIIRLSRLEQKGEAQFQQFMVTFLEFVENQNENDSDQRQKLKECINKLDKVPQETQRDDWVALMINILPENHPIKQKFNQLKDAAEEIFNLNEGERQSPKKRRPKRKNHQKKERLDEKFPGEKQALSAVVKPTTAPKATQETPEIPLKKYWDELEKELGSPLQQIRTQGGSIKKPAIPS